MNFASPTWAKTHFAKHHNPSDTWEGNIQTQPKKTDKKQFLSVNLLVLKIIKSLYNY
jgi:hypothetical protein